MSKQPEGVDEVTELKHFIAKVTAGVLILLVGVLSLTWVSTGHVGVVTHFGAVQPSVLPAGIHVTRPWPFASVSDMDIRVGTTEADALAASKDLQGVKTKVSVQWSITDATAPRVLQGFGGEHEMEASILAPAIQEVVKSVSAKYTAEQLITDRTAVKLGIEQELAAFVKKSLSEKGAIGAIRIANVAVTNFEFSKEFDASIEAKVKAEQDSLRAENEKKTRVTQAEAAFAEQKLKADGEAYGVHAKADANAYQTEVESKARAAAIDREARALQVNPSIVQLRTAEAWDGKLPMYTGGAVPWISVK